MLFNKFIYFLVNFFFFFRKEELIVQCKILEQQLTESKNSLKVIEDNRQPFLTRLKEIKGNFIKLQNKQDAFNKLVKDIESTQSELKKEEENSTSCSKKITVCWL